MERHTVLARITGRVQGVAFRAWTEHRARGLGLDGWVKNEADGSVTALIAGPTETVATMLEALHRGPDLARVDTVATEMAEDPGDTGFAILR
ncbi:acylphosphatase [Acidimangrovimonas sediminis]|uniref:acylphosphatase n=1 Tax=Acidimangrovimonas sediminis TaxID=2056283 RepID=UPI000C7FCEDD|nr:acylphosphatase [Acidimangrovimonas sediminis]